MLNSIQIRNYRILSELDVDGLSRINLIAGRNNSGKTSLLEAIFLLSSGGNPKFAVGAKVIRGFEDESLPTDDSFVWEDMFSELNVDSPIEIIGKHTSFGTLFLRISWNPESIGVPIDVSEEGLITGLSHQRTLTFYYSANGNDPVGGFITSAGNIQQPHAAATRIETAVLSSRSDGIGEDALHLGLLRKQKRGGLLLDALRVVEPRLCGMEVISAPNPVIMGDVGLSELIPLSAMGEGMTRLARMVLAIASSPGGVVLIDEVEKGFHYSALPKVWAVIGSAAAKFDVQVFATTHSLECIRAAHKSLDADAFRLHRLEAIDSAIRCVTYDPEVMEASIRHNFEVR